MHALYMSTPCACFSGSEPSPAFAPTQPRPGAIDALTVLALPMLPLHYPPLSLMVPCVTVKPPWLSAQAPEMVILGAIQCSVHPKITSNRVTSFRSGNSNYR